MSATILDISGLPKSVMDHRSAIWWGNLLLLIIESTMFALLLGSYFYVWQNFELWPPVQSNRFPILYRPLPDLGTATAILALLLLSTVPMLWASRACLALDARSVRIGLVVVDLCGLAAIWLEWVNLGSVHFKWSDNAYGSVVWALLVLHLLHAIVSTTENTLMTVWLALKGLDEKHARDVRVTAVYWYWVAGVWPVIYAVVYWAPRVV